MPFSNISSASVRLILTIGNVTESHRNMITGPHWDFMQDFAVFAVAGSLLTNCVVLSLICYDKDQRKTVFSIYLINLFVSNIIMMILRNIPDIIAHIYSGWWLGEFYCSILVFGSWVSGAIVQYCHTVIGVNRIWAIYWPHSYRGHHNRRVAVLLCAISWISVGALVLPGFVLDTMYYRKDIDVYGCQLNNCAQVLWATIVQFVVYDSGPIFMWIAFPLIYFKRRQLLRVEAQQSLSNQVSEKKDAAEAHVGAVSLARRSGNSRQRSRQGGPVQQPTGPRRMSKSIRILVLLTVSVTVCWVPKDVVYTMGIYVPAGESETSLRKRLINPAIVLFSLQSVIDPILFVWAMPDLQRAFKNTFDTSISS